jgi:hypothetical protein
MKVCVLSANLGGFDFETKHIPQSVKCDYYMFTDKNFPPRSRAMTPRLQAKIPKCFGWQLVPGYDYYLWIDSNINFARKDAVKFFVDKCKGSDIAIFRHQRRPDIRQEYRYSRKGVKQGRLYLVGRYTNEYMREIYEIIKADKDYVDDFLVNGGVFIYKNVPKVRKALKEWWYFISRYAIQDQLSFAYVLKKARLKMKILNEDIYLSPYLSFQYHKIRKE